VKTFLDFYRKGLFDLYLKQSAAKRRLGVAIAVVAGLAIVGGIAALLLN
jgi:hypothetical protein